MYYKSLCIFIVAALTACSHIDEDERLIYEKPAPAARTVLLEDFTGQRCVNCPRGTEVIEKLQQELGDEAFIAVGIHGGPLGFKGTAKALGLATDVGDEYYNHWHLEYQPVGLVNRHGAENYTDWTAAVKEELSKPAPLSLSASAHIADEKVSISISALGTDGITEGRLQVWLIEDGITAMQMMPDGSTNPDYVHNHVLRTPVNGTWGQDFSIREGEKQKLSMEQKLDDAWNREKLSVVAFIYNDKGVQQATKTKIEN